MRTSRAFIGAVVIIAAVAMPSAITADSPGFALGAAVLASGASPFAGCTAGVDPNAPAPETVYTDTETEPFVAVDPTSPDNIIGAYQQDRWTDGGSKGLVASRSHDGGATWARNYAEFSTCSDDGNPAYVSPFPRATDPWVSFDSAGKAYQISLGLVSATGIFSGVEVATSADDGGHWSTPVRVITDNDPIFFNDKESITGDWRSGVGAGKAYATWIRGNLPGWDSISITGANHSFAYRGLPMFSKTTDGGAHWSQPISITNANIYVQGNQIVVLPDGTLMDIAAALFRGSGSQPTPQQAFWTAFTSKDGGKTWGAPIKIAPLGTVLLTNPDIPNPTSLDQTVRAGDYLPDVAVDHATGDVYMVFANNDGSGFDHVMLTKSTNGGKTWSSPKDVTKTPSNTHSFNGTVEVTDQGIVAVMYYDFRNNTGSPGLPTDIWLTHSHDGGATWDEQHVYGSFDMENAPVSRGWFLGDYQGMAAIPGSHDLILFFGVAAGTDNSADIIAVRANR
jgi:hypothetical protein